MKARDVLAVLLLLILSYHSGIAQRDIAPPSAGYVPDEATAIAIGMAVLKPIYGEEHVRNEAPFHATLQRDGYWLVTGTLPKPRNPNLLVVGGTGTVEIDKQSGRIIAVYHGK